MRDDPYWTTARFNSGDIKRGDRIFYYPRSRRALKGDEAEQAARDFDAARADESL